MPSLCSTLRVQCLLPVLLLMLLSGVCHGQVCANTTTSVSVAVGTTSTPLTQFSCDSTSYPSAMAGTFINNGSTGNLTWIVYNIASGIVAGRVLSTSPQAPTTNGASITTCFPPGSVSVPVGTTYGLYIKCDSNGTSPVGQCSLQYNVTLTCQRAAGFSSTGSGAEAVSAVGVYTWGAMLLATVVMMMAL